MKRPAAEAFDYGEYERLWADKRTRRVIATLDRLTEERGVEYVIVGGLAAFLHARNPPEDYPDIDVLLYAKGNHAIAFIRALSTLPRFARRFLDSDGDEVFASFVYDDDIQIDVFTSSDEAAARTKAKRVQGAWIEPVEPLIVEKLIRGTQADIRMVLDLLAYCDYDKRLLAQIGREFKVTGALSHAAYFARRMAAGLVAKDGIAAVVKRLATA